jgi:LAO/AO transport system kinase
VADIFVVNKADRDGAQSTVRDLRSMLSLGGRHSAPGAWRPPVLTSVASRGEGIAEILDAVDRHSEWLDKSGELQRRRCARASAEIEGIAVAALRRQIGDLRGVAALESLAGRVVAGESDPYAAADELLSAVAP